MLPDGKDRDSEKGIQKPYATRNKQVANKHDSLWSANQLLWRFKFRTNSTSAPSIAQRIRISDKADSNYE